MNKLIKNNKEREASKMKKTIKKVITLATIGVVTKAIFKKQTKTNSKNSVFYGSDKPKNTKKGDIWFDTTIPGQPKFHQF